MKFCLKPNTEKIMMNTLSQNLQNLFDSAWNILARG